MFVMTETIEKTVREIAVDCPGSVRVFESLGIDYCCGGKKSLRDACSSANVSFDRVVRMLQEAAAAPIAGDDAAWSAAPLDSLTAHIVQKHHGYVRQEIPDVGRLLEKVVGKHGPAHPELSQVKQEFELLAQELTSHMMKEEQILFPYIERMADARLHNQPLPAAFFGTVERPIANMVADHDDAGTLLADLRRLTNNYTAPDGACPTFRALYHRLAEFEQDLHQHIHLENNILFPRAIEMERKA
jgi:regulator of cell morphogenesis and NO signaling